MTSRPSTRVLTKAAIVGISFSTFFGSVAGNGGKAGAADTASAPGVTSNAITVGTISTQTGPLAGNAAPVIYGEKAYFDYINAKGGVNGRKIDYKYALDDGGNPSQFANWPTTWSIRIMCSRSPAWLRSSSAPTSWSSRRLRPTVTT